MILPMKIFSVFVIIAFIPFLNICSPGGDPEPPSSPDQWQKLGLSDLNIEEINFYHNQLFAGTENGMFTKNVADSDTIWQPIGLQGKKVLDFIVFSPDEIIASVDLSVFPKGVSIYRTTDGGNSWEPYQNGFGGDAGQTCYALDHNPAAPDTIFGRAAFAVGKSTDRGQSWRTVLGEWGTIGYQSDLIHIDEHNPNIVWAGGETTIFAPYLTKSTNYGETWEGKPVPSSGDNAVYDIAINKRDSDVIVVGMEGQLIRSTDGGDNFDIVVEPEGGTYFLTLDRNPIFSNIVYASGSEFGTTPGQLFFYKSKNFGRTWTKVINNEDPVDNIATRDMEAHAFTIKPGLYMGTNKGVWRYCGRQLLTQAEAQ